MGHLSMVWRDCGEQEQQVWDRIVGDDGTRQ